MSYSSESRRVGRVSSTQKTLNKHQFLRECRSLVLDGCQSFLQRQQTNKTERHTAALLNADVHGRNVNRLYSMTTPRIVIVTCVLMTLSVRSSNVLRMFSRSLVSCRMSVCIISTPASTVSSFCNQPTTSQHLCSVVDCICV